MKKTLSINLNGVVWTINEDAYQELKNYLDELENNFSSDDEKEILNDIEARISELLSERMDKKRTIVEIADVEYVISVLGKVSDFSEEREEKVQEGKKQSKRFYRDPENKIIAGVAGGLAAYLGWDPTIVRILFVLLVIFGFSYFLPIYLLIWLIAPEAISSSQKLEMKGIDVTIDNIKNIKSKISESMPAGESVKTFGQRIGEIIVGIFKWGFIIFGGIIGVIIAITCASIILGLLIFGIIALADPTLVTDFMNINFLILFISIFILCLFPLIGAICLVIRLLSRKPRKKNRLWVFFLMFVIWVIAFFTMIFSGIRLGTSDISKYENFYMTWNGSKFALEKNPETIISEPRQVSDFNSICVEKAVKVELIQKDSCSVRVFADASYITNVTTEVRDSILFITNNTKNSATVEISMPTIKSIIADKASKIEGEIISENLEILLNGASKADLNLNAKKLTLHIGQASNVEMEGNTEKLSLVVNGASKADLEELKVKNADVSVRSASNVKIWAVDSLKTNLSGASYLKYKGFPVVSNIIQDSSRIKNDND